MFEAVGFTTCTLGTAHTSARMTRQKITPGEVTRGWIAPTLLAPFNLLKRILFPQVAKEKWALAKVQLAPAYAKSWEACPRSQPPA